jgi:hypothetical protein
VTDHNYVRARPRFTAGTGAHRRGLIRLQEKETDMADPERPTPSESPVFETDTVQADRAREQGLGLGERELNAQRDPGGVRTPDEADPDALDQSVEAEDSDDSEDSRTANPAV